MISLNVNKNKDSIITSINDSRFLIHDQARNMNTYDIVWNEKIESAGTKVLRELGVLKLLEAMGPQALMQTLRQSITLATACTKPMKYSTSFSL